jgi:hypothetical protein
VLSPPAAYCSLEINDEFDSCMPRRPATLKPLSNVRVWPPSSFT